ncbi:hypothetical protein BpHYR1_008829 [Brachionus plicatilis]|uniref:Uncharacterized protein n=1 Tax=Brachionus plicatilis TaxID=10195 RepID=A0A3M7R6R9_BRAPC|nr:hypothetical protein BpHYR1_008829 [Brachionus plicatilis]
MEANSVILNGSCTLPGQLSMDNHICLIGGQIFYFIVHTYMIVHGQLSGKEIGAKKELLLILSYLASKSCKKILNLHTVGISKTKCPLRSRPKIEPTAAPNRTNRIVPNRTEPLSKFIFLII